MGSFLSQGGDAQQAYERLRRAALDGGALGAFAEFGTALLACPTGEPARRVWDVRRRRSSMREGEFPLAAWLLELGVFPRPGGSPRQDIREFEHQEVAG